MVDPNNVVMAFSGFEVDTASRVLRRGNEVIPLAPKAFDCLAYLLQHRSRAVGRDELISAVWGRTDLTYAVLSQTLWKLRRALNEADVGDSEFIRTLPRFGYQWISPLTPPRTVPADAGVVDSIGSEPEETLSASASPSSVRTEDAGWRNPKVAWWIAIACAAVLVVLAASWTWWSRSLATDSQPLPTNESNPPARRFLVLPVALDAARPDDAWLRLGLMDYFATRLRRSDRLQVIGSDRVLSLLGDKSVNDLDSEENISQLLLVAGATDIVAPRAVHTDTGWRVVLAHYSNEGTRTFEGLAGRALDAIDDAGRRLLHAEGIEDSWQRSATNATTELIQRMDAESLAGNHARALEIARSADATLQGDPIVRLRVAQGYYRSGQIDAAKDEFAALASRADDLAAPVRVGAVIGLANIDERRQQYAAAERGYTAAVALLGSRGDSTLLSQAYSMRGLVNTYLGHNDLGFADFARARIEFARGGDEVGLAGLDANIGLAERARGRHQDAADAFDRAVAVFDRFDIRDRAASALIGAIGERLSLVQIPQAVALSERAETLAAQVQSPILRIYLSLVRGESLLADGRLNALQTLLDGLGPAADPSAPEAVPDLLLLRVSAAAQAGRPRLGAGEIQRILKRIENPAESAYRTSLAAAVITLSDYALEVGDLPFARQLIERLRQPDAEGDRFRPLADSLLRAQLLATSGDSSSTIAFTAALAEADRTAYPDAIVTVAVAWSRHMNESSDPGAMAMLAGRLQPFAPVDFRAAHAAAALYALLGEERLASDARARATELAHDRDARAVPATPGASPGPSPARS